MGLWDALLERVGWAKPKPQPASLPPAPRWPVIPTHDPADPAADFDEKFTTQPIGEFLPEATETAKDIGRQYDAIETEMKASLHRLDPVMRRQRATPALDSWRGMVDNPWEAMKGFASPALVGDVLEAPGKVLGTVPGTLYALPAAIGEELADTTLPEDRGESPGVLNRALSHLKRAWTGGGGPNIGGNLVNALVNPPDSFQPERQDFTRGGITVSPAHKTTETERTISEVGRRLGGTAVNMALDPTFVATFARGAAIEPLKALFAAASPAFFGSAISHQYRVAHDPNSTVADNIEAAINSLMMGAPLGLNPTHPITEPRRYLNAQREAGNIASSMAARLTPNAVPEKPAGWRPRSWVAEENQPPPPGAGDFWRQKDREARWAAAEAGAAPTKPEEAPLSPAAQQAIDIANKHGKARSADPNQTPLALEAAAATKAQRTKLETEFEQALAAGTPEGDARAEELSKILGSEIYPEETGKPAPGIVFEAPTQKGRTQAEGVQLPMREGPADPNNPFAMEFWKWLGERKSDQADLERFLSMEPQMREKTPEWQQFVDQVLGEQADTQRFVNENEPLTVEPIIEPPLPVEPILPEPPRVAREDLPIVPPTRGRGGVGIQPGLEPVNPAGEPLPPVAPPRRKYQTDEEAGTTEIPRREPPIVPPRRLGQETQPGLPPAAEPKPRTEGFSATELEDILSGKTTAPPVEVVEPNKTTVNGSGESAVSAEAQSRLAGMKARGERFVKFDRAGTMTEVPGADAVDYKAQNGETFGIWNDTTKIFQILDNKGGNYGGKLGAANAKRSEGPATPPAASTASPAPPPPAAAPAPSAAPAPARPPESVVTPAGEGFQPDRSVVEIPPEQTGRIGVDPKAYQFKESDAQGVTGALAGVREWDPNSPPILVHERADGSLWVADGHQRLAKYRELQAQGKKLPPLRARIIREADGYTVADVRRSASLRNVQEGSARATDIAKLLREGPLTENERARVPKGAMAGARLRHAEGLAELSDEAWQAVVNGEASPEAAAQVAKYFTDPAEQLAAVRSLGRRGITNPTEGEAYVASLRDGMLARKEKSAQGRLFEDDPEFVDLAAVRAKLVTKMSSWLNRRRAAFRDVLKNAPILEEAKFSMDEETGKALGEEAGNLLGYFRKYADQRGTETNTALRELSQEIYAKRITPDDATNQLADAVRRDIETGGGGGNAAPEARPAEGQPAGAGADGQLARGPEGVRAEAPAEPPPVANSLEDILNEAKRSPVEPNPKLADVPFDLTGGKALPENAPPPTKGELESLGQQDMFAPAEKPITERPKPKSDLEELLQPVEKPTTPPKEPPQEEPPPAAPVPEPVEPKPPAPAAPAKTELEQMLSPRKYRESPPEDYQKMTRARNAAMDAAVQRGQEWVNRLNASKPKAEQIYEAEGADAVVEYWKKAQQQIEEAPVSKQGFTPWERIGDNAEVVAPPERDFVALRLESVPDREVRDALTAAGFRYKKDLGQWIGNVEGPTNRRGRPREDLLADAKRILGAKESPKPSETVAESLPETKPAEPTTPKRPLEDLSDKELEKLYADESLYEKDYKRFKEIEKEFNYREEQKAAAEETPAPAKPEEAIRTKPELDAQDIVPASDDVQRRIEQAIEETPEPTETKTPLEEVLEPTTYEQLAPNERSFLKRQAGLTEDAINEMTPEEARARGKAFGEEQRRRREEAALEAKRAAAGQPVKSDPLDSILNAGPLEKEVKAWRDVADRLARGEEITDIENYGPFVQALQRRITRAKQIREALKARERLPVGEKEAKAPEVDEETVQQFASLAAEIDDFSKMLAPGKGAKRGSKDESFPGGEYQLPRAEQERLARMRSALLEKGTPEALDEYQRLLGEMQDRITATKVRTNAQGAKLEGPPRSTDPDAGGEYLGSMFGGFPKVLEIYRKDPQRFWTIMRRITPAITGYVGAQADEENPLEGFIYGAMLGMTPMLLKRAGTLQLDKVRGAMKLGFEKPTGDMPIRREPKANRDLNLLEVLAPFSAETVVPDAYRKALAHLRGFNDAITYGTLKDKPIDVRKTAAKISVRRAVESIREAAAEAKKAGYKRKAAYLDDLADAMAKKPTAWQVGAKRLAERAGIDAKYDWVENLAGANTYRVLTGWAIDSALQNLTQPLLALRHVTAGDLLWAYKVSRTQWARDMTRHTTIKRPTDLHEELVQMEQANGKPKSKLARVWEDRQLLLAKSDNFNRRVVYLAAMRQAARRGLFGEFAGEWARAVKEQTFVDAYRTEADVFAQKVMRDTQGDVGPMAMNPLYRGPLGGSLRPFLKYPTLLARNLFDVVLQPDARGRNRYIASVATAVLLGKAMGLDLEDALLMGGKPFGIDVTKPGDAVKKVASGDIFPVVKALKDVGGHLAGSANHAIASTDPDEFLDSDLAYLLAGRYPVKVAKTLGRTLESDIVPALQGQERTAHKYRTPSGAVNPLSLPEDLASLVGLKPTRVAERAELLSEASGEYYQEQAATKAKMADLKRRLRYAMDDDNQEEASRILNEMALTSRSSRAPREALRGINRSQWQRLMDQASPRVRAMLQQKYGEGISNTELER